MRVELLYFDGCPNHQALLPHLRELLAHERADAEIRLVRVENDDAATEHRFLGSPTVRVNGRDVDAGAGERTDYGLKCRLYATAEGLDGMPPDEWVLATLAHAAEGGRMQSIDLAELKRLVQSGAQLVEVLPEEEYAEEHLPGAISIPLKVLDAQTSQQLDRSKPVVVYCYDGL